MSEPAVTTRFKGDLAPLQRATQRAGTLLKKFGGTNFGQPITQGANRAAKALGTVSKSAKNFATGLTSGVKLGAAGIAALTNKVILLKEVLGAAANAAKAIGEAIMKPAMTLEKQTFALESILGSAEKANAMMGTLSDTAQRFGLDLAGIQEQAVTLAVISDGDIAQANEYAKAIARVAALRPDLPGQRKMGVVFALREGDFSRASMLLDIPAEKLKAMAGIAEETGDTVSKAVGQVGGGGEKALGQFTSVVSKAKGAGACGEKLAENIKKGLGAGEINALLSKLGASDAMMSKVSGSMIGKIQKLKNHWLEFRQVTGGKILEALAGPSDKVLTWLEDNDEMVTRLAESLGTLVAEGIQKLVEWAESGGLDLLIEGFREWAEIIAGLAESLKPLFQGAGKFLGDVVGPQAGGQQAPSSFGGAVGRAVFKPQEAFAGAANTMRLTAAVGAGKLGQLFGGQALGAKWAQGVANVPLASERQAVDIRVSVDDDMRLSAQVDGRIGQNNGDMVSSWYGHQPVPSFGGAQ